MNRKCWNDERGMTIIEVLIVMLIIGILSAIAVPYYGRVQDQAKDKKMMTDLRNLAIAIGLYRVDHDKVPNAANATELIEVLKTMKGNSTPLFDKDPWGNHYDYFRDVSADSYTLRCRGRDGLVGEPASETNFNVDNDTMIANGIFVASHHGSASIAH